MLSSLHERGHPLRHFVALILLLWATLAAAGDIWVISSEDAPVNGIALSAAADLFLGRSAGESTLVPFDQSDPRLRAEFYRAIADLSLASVRAHWVKRVFTGHGRPPATIDMDGFAAVLRGNPGAVTYMNEGKLPPGSKILLKVQVGEKP